MKKIAIILSFVLICLSACGPANNEKNEDVNNENIGTEIKQEESQQEDIVLPSDSENETQYDLTGKLKKAEEDSAVLEKKLLEDASLKQSDMNELSYEIYVIWDDLLNEIWQEMKETLPEDTMNMILTEQRQWIFDKEEQVEKEQAAYEGGSMAPLVGNRKAAELTKSRVYELAKYLSE